MIIRQTFYTFQRCRGIQQQGTIFVSLDVFQYLHVEQKLITMHNHLWSM